VDSVFVAQHKRRIKPLVEANGINCFEAIDSVSLKLALNELHNTVGPAVLEVLTPDELNPKVLKQYFDHLKKESNEQ